MEQNRLGNFGIGNYEEHLCEIILTLVQQWIKDISTFSSGGHFVWLSRTLRAILAESIMGNIHEKLFKIWTSV